MKQIREEDSWPSSWKESCGYDRREVFDQDWGSLGYTYAYKNRRREALKMVSAAAGPGASVLDVAAAQGNFTLALAEMGYRVTWNDLREELIGYVKLKYEFGDVQFAPGDVFELQFPKLFDVVLILEIIEHVAHPDEFLKKAASLVRPGGHIVMTTPNGSYFRNRLPRFSEFEDTTAFEARQFLPNSDGHIFLLHDDEIRSLAEAAGLRAVALKYFNNSLTSGHVKLGAVLPLLPRALIAGIEQLSRRLPPPFLHVLNVHVAALLQRPSDASGDTFGRR